MIVDCKGYHDWSIKNNHCMCGCGELVTCNYKRGHSRRYQHNSIEHNIKIGNANRTGREDRKTRYRRTYILKPFREKRQINYIETTCAYCNSELYLFKCEVRANNFCNNECRGLWLKDNKWFQRVAEKCRLARIGHVASTETRKKISLANSGINNGCYGKVYSEEEKRRQSELTKRSWANPEIAAKRRQYFKSPEGKISCRLGALKTAEKLKGMWYNNTTPELKMLNIFKRMWIEFIHSYPVWSIEHKYVADFYIPEINAIVEVDGKFYHNYPHGTETDNIRNKEMVDKGYNVIRFWEDEIEENIVKERLLAYV